MKKILVVGMVMCFASSLALAPVYAENVEQAAQQVQAELQKQGVSAEDAAKLKEPVQEMLANGASKDEVVKPLAELSKSEVKGSDLKNSAESMNELVKSGATPKEAGNVVSQAAHQAKAEGIKGKALAARVHEAVKARQAEKRAAQAEKKAAKEVEKQSKEMKKVEKQAKEKKVKAEKQAKEKQEAAENQTRERTREMKGKSGKKGWGK